MNGDLIPTTDAAILAGVSVATINRWAAARRLPVAFQAPGETGARFYRRADVLAAARHDQGNPVDGQAAS